MKLYDLIISRRTIRAFQDKPVARKLLDNFVNAARLAPAAANRQPLRYIVVDDSDICNNIFPNIRLAGYLDWSPTAEVQPRAYIVITVDKKLQKPTWIPFDVACAAENICLAAWDEGIGSCMIGAYNKTEVKDVLLIPHEIDIGLIVALGYPAHESKVEDIKGEKVEYWRDEDGAFHVPKRSLKSVTRYNKYT